MLKRMFTLGGVLLAALIVEAVSIRVVWDPSPDAVKGYKVYVSMISQNYADVIPFTFGDVTTFVIPDLAPGQTYYVVATAYDAYGQESDFSNEISVSIPEAPRSPGVLAISGQ